METINDNLRLLAAETLELLEATRQLLVKPEVEQFQKLFSRDDYIDNLKTIIENNCFSRIHSVHYVNDSEINLIRAMHTIGVNLERVADFCVNIGRQMEFMTDPGFIGRFDTDTMFKTIADHIPRILETLREKNLTGALTICRVEYTLDQLFKINFDLIMEKLHDGIEVQNHITSLFIFRYLERIGDSMLNIGEALLFAIVGEKIKINQFDALQETLEASGFEGRVADVDVQSLWGSRSGCRISRVAPKKNPDPRTRGIFKEGNVGKIRKEKLSIERWESFFPGLAPRIFGYHETGQNASFLVEYLPGCTLDQVVLTTANDILANAYFLLQQIIEEVWETSQRRRPVTTDYMGQLQQRLETVRRVHPRLMRTESFVQNVEIAPTARLIKACAELESTLAAPFSVFIHGDFNINNIVYDHTSQRIHYIDLYRSRDADYVQDASVFLISNFRLPIFEPTLRLRLNWVIVQFYDFLKDFAHKHQDGTFAARLALALARSFYTSTRFELNKHFARTMYLRAHFLMEKLARHDPADWEAFRFPEDVLCY